MSRRVLCLCSAWLALRVSCPALPDFRVLDAGVLIQGSGARVLQSRVENAGGGGNGGQLLAAFFRQPSPAQGWQLEWQGATPCGEIKGGSVSTVTVALPALHVLPLGEYRLLLTVDVQNLTAEENEDNNTFETSLAVPGPDFIVNKLAASSTEIEPGQIFSVGGSVKNLGVFANAGSLVASFWRESGPAPGTREFILQRGVPIGNVGYLVGMPFELGGLSHARPGTYACVARADGLQGTAESIETNNEAVVAYHVGGPDLVVERLQLPGKNPAAASAIGPVQVSIRNEGSLAAAGSWLHVWATNDVPGGGGRAPEASMPVPSLAPGELREFVVNLAAGPAAAGRFALQARVDALQQVDEVFECNNLGFVTYDTASADLVVEKIELVPRKPGPGGLYKALVTVRNAGPADVPAGQAFVVGIREPSSALSRILPQSGLAADRRVTLAFENLRAPYREGNHRLTAEADLSAAVSELQETNNAAVLDFLVSPLPDFAVTEFRLLDEPVPAGGLFRVSVTIENQGGGPGNLGTTRFVWEKKDAAGKVVGASEANLALWGSLGPGQEMTRVCSFGPTPSNGWPYCTNTVILDAANQTAESDEANNARPVPYAMVPADLDITAMRVEPRFPSAGQAYRLYARVKNAGSFPTLPGITFLDVQKYPSGATARVEIAAAGALAAGQEIEVWQNMPPSAPGFYSATGRADGRSQVAEADEQNNTFPLHFWIGADALQSWSVVAEFEKGFTPGEDQLRALREQLRKASNFLMDATDGQFRLGDVYFCSNGAAPALQADVRMNITPGQGANSGDRINLGLGALWGYSCGTIVHELGHYKFDLKDEYFGSPGNLIGVATYCGSPERSHSIMDRAGNPYGSSEFCTPSGRASRHQVFTWADDVPFPSEQDLAHPGESAWETIARLHPAVAIPAADPDPGPCSRSRDPHSAASHEPLEQWEGVGWLVDFHGP